MSSPNDKPRPHHYRFAHRVLPSILQLESVDPASLLESDDLDDALARTWVGVGEEEREPDRLPPTGLRSALVTVGDSPGLAVVLPEALNMTEAHLAILTPLNPPTQRRYFTLESSWDYEASDRSTAVCERTKDGHLNFGAGGAATDLNDFVARIAAIVGSR